MPSPGQSVKAVDPTFAGLQEPILALRVSRRAKPAPNLPYRRTPAPIGQRHDRLRLVGEELVDRSLGAVPMQRVIVVHEDKTTTRHAGIKYLNPAIIGAYKSQSICTKL